LLTFLFELQIPIFAKFEEKDFDMHSFMEKIEHKFGPNHLKKVFIAKF
jgi:hypothetical protein